ncbi:hypothetical protein [Aestuariibacter salexigens]|uniref:hypothetical protein n=1 Tax=Aestuariibacter salexigens TaxID=226010 RepID=UPI000408BD83|nr:hypothetical protein [Aestuariibacter salexigens]
MSSQDPLQQLWQSQPTSAIDIDNIKRRLRNLRIKQWGYTFLDLAGLVVVFVVLWISRNDLHVTLQIGLGIVLVATVGLTGYLLWLRRHALFIHSLSTEQYVETLKLQLANNVKIAWLTRHSSWVTALLMILMWVGFGLYGDMSPQRYVQKLAIVLVSLAVFMPMIWWWASKREARFKAELDALKRQTQQFD